MIKFLKKIERKSEGEVDNYVKQVEELIVLYDQGHKMQRQIEQMQQAL